MTVPGPDLQERRVLVIDDTASIHEDFRKILAAAARPGSADPNRLQQLEAELFGSTAAAPAPTTRLQFLVDSANQGEEGRDALAAALQRQEPYAVAFVDMRMPPGWDGLRTIRELWTVDPRLEVVICTAYSDYSWEEISRQLGVTDKLLILKKPFDGIEVRQLAMSLTTKWQLTQRAQDESQSLTRLVAQKTIELTERTHRLELEVSEHQRTQAEMKLAKEQAEAANRAKSDFLSAMSHDIRTPLNGVIGMLELMLSTPMNQKQVHYLEVARSSANTLLSLINDILDFSKIESGKMEMEVTPFNLHMAMDELVQSFEHAADKKQLELTCHVHPEVPAEVAGDWLRLRQVLTNLLGNALKFTEKGGIVLHCALEEYTADQALLRFSVTDTGIGIPAERMGRLFAAFSQVDASTTRKYGGSGLGLAICKRLTQAMGGQIGVSSELGHGSTFWFTARVKQATRDAGVPLSQSARDPRRLRVLAVGLPETERLRLPEALAQWGGQLVIAMGHNEALAQLDAANAQQSPFTVFLIDIDTPGVDARALASAAALRPNPPRVLLALTATTVTSYTPGELVGMGFCGMVRKPAGPEEFFSAIVEAATTAALPPRPGPHHAPHTPRVVVSTKKGARVLLAEDNEVNQLVAREIIEQAGLACAIAGDGQQAIDMAMSGNFDLVLMDCQMPVMDGFDATREIRRRQRLPGAPPKRLPIIALTANALAGDRAQCMQAGMDAYITKPVDAAKLITAIDQALADFQPPTAAPTAAGSTPVSPIHLLANTLAGAPGSSANDTPADPQAPMDPRVLLERCLNRMDLAQMIVQRFDQQARENVRELDQLLAGGDALNTRRVAHTLKGAAGLLSATRLADLAEQLETMGRLGALENAAAVFEQLRAEVDRVLTYAPQSLAEVQAQGK